VFTSGGGGNSKTFFVLVSMLSFSLAPLQRAAAIRAQDTSCLDSIGWSLLLSLPPFAVFL
jgi:hypothetical protein